MHVLHFHLPYIVWIKVIMWVLHFAPTYNVHVLNCHASIAFSFFIFSTHLLLHQFRMEVRGACEVMVYGARIVLYLCPNWVVLHVNFTNTISTPSFGKSSSKNFVWHEANCINFPFYSILICPIGSFFFKPPLPFGSIIHHPLFDGHVLKWSID
jgi:hypothetical protein